MCSASDLRHMITMSAYGRRSPGPLLHVTHPAPETSEGTWKGRAREGTAPAPHAATPKGSRAGPGGGPGAGRHHPGEQGSTRDRAGPKSPALRDTAGYQKATATCAY